MLQTPSYIIEHVRTRSPNIQLQISDGSGEPIMYASSKFISLSGNAEVYADEDLQVPLLSIRTSSILSGKYDITDLVEERALGTLEPIWLGLAWKILGPDGKEIGRFRVASKFLFYTGVVLHSTIHVQPLARTYSARLGDATCRIRHTNWPRTSETSIEFADGSAQFDRQLGLALGILLCTVPG